MKQGSIDGIDGIGEPIMRTEVEVRVGELKNEEA